jgi:hypothetical protein
VTKRRRRLLALLALAALAGAVAVPAVHWRLIGWAKWEPFYRSRPASYWRAEIAACDVTSLVGPRWENLPSPVPPPPLPGLLERVMIRVRLWLAVQLNWPLRLPLPFATPLSDADPSAVPVLMTLLPDPEPKVRYYAVKTLGSLGATARPALPALRGMVKDRAEVYPRITVADTVPVALYRIDTPPVTASPPGRPASP